MRRTRPLPTNCIKRMLFRVRVSGESCWPALVPNRSYWASALGRIQVGDFVVFENPTDREQILVKRVCEVRAERYEVDSTVSWGLSSADFGVVEKGKVLGRIISNQQTL